MLYYLRHLRPHAQNLFHARDKLKFDQNECIVCVVWITFNIPIISLVTLDVISILHISVNSFRLATIMQYFMSVPDSIL